MVSNFLPDIRDHKITHRTGKNCDLRPHEKKGTGDLIQRFSGDGYGKHDEWYKSRGHDYNSI